jgi:hypothetical protein
VRSKQHDDKHKGLFVLKSVIIGCFEKCERRARKCEIFGSRGINHTFIRDVRKDRKIHKQYIVKFRACTSRIVNSGTWK